MPRKGNWKRLEAKSKAALDRNRRMIEAAPSTGTRAGRRSTWSLKVKRED